MNRSHPLFHRPLLSVQTALLVVFVASTATAATPFGRPAERSGRGPQGYAGINFRDVAEEQIGLLRLKEARGEEIILVDHDGPASKAGLREHDVIVQANGQPIDGEDQLRRMLRETPPGRRIAFVISREGQQQTLTIQLANRDTIGRDAWDRHMTVAEPAQNEGPMPHGIGFLGGNAISAGDLTRHSSGGTANLNSSYTGALLDTMGPQLAIFFGAQTGLLVKEVDPDSPAAVAGLRAGDVVIRVNAVPVLIPADWMKTVQASKGKALAVVVLRDKHEQTLSLIPDARRRSGLQPAPISGAFPEPEIVVGMILGPDHRAR